MKKSMMLFGCGGAGINVVQRFASAAGKHETGFTEINPVFLDTSRSNLAKGLNEESVYIIDGLDGSGKRRDANHKPISERTKEILQRFKPGDINVVVHSASGGSGSVLGPTIVSELLDRNEPVIVIMIGGTDSRIEAHNTGNTLKSYENISRKRGMPVIAVYYENSKEMPRGEVDSRIETTIAILAAVFSGDNRELDSEDLKNFLDYTKVTDFSSKLSYLDFFTGDIAIGRDQSVVTVLTLTDESTPSYVEHPIGYQSVGFICDAARDKINVSMPIRATVISGFFNGVMDRLNKRLKEIDDNRKAHVEKSILSHDVDDTDEGLVL